MSPNLLNLPGLSIFFSGSGSNSLGFVLMSALFTYSDPSLFVTTLFSFIFFFKIGLPPFIFWKVLVFDNAPLNFIYNYNLPYFLTLLLYTLYLLTTLLSLGLNPTHHYLYLLTSIIAVVVITERTFSLGSFFAVSSSLTSIFIFVVYLLTLEIGTLNLADPVIIKPTLTYLALYVASLLLFFSLLFSLGVKSGSAGVTSLVPDKVNSRRVLNLIRIYFFLILSSFAGVPPLSSFFAKLLLLTNLNTSSTFPMQLTALIFLAYLFSMLVFYFKLAKPLLIQNSASFSKSLVNNAPKTYSSNLKTDLNLNRSYCIMSFVLVLGFFLINDFLLYLAL